MKKAFKPVYAMLALFLLVAGVWRPGTAGGAPESEVVRGNTEFALDLYRRLAAEDGNLAFAPYGVSSALAMVCAGARGETEAAMLNTLHLKAVGRLNTDAAFSSLNRSLPSSRNRNTCEVHLANAVWLEKRFQIVQEFTEVARLCYGAQAATLDFAREPAKSRNTINAWVAGKTQGRIPELLEPGILDGSTRIVLTNALYFKGAWASPFPQDQTRPAPFTILSGKKKPVQMMTQTGVFPYMEDDLLQAVALPYAGGGYAMVLLLPKAKKGFPRMEKSLDRDYLAITLKSLQPRPAELYIPRFRVTKAADLSNSLAYMGMNDAFTPAADFSGMTLSRDIFLSAVIHQTYVDVNEAGTEAASATAAVLNLKSLPESGKKAVFRADHPFLFLIRDERTETILFLGRLSTP